MKRALEARGFHRRRARSHVAIWHDGPDSELFQDGLALCEQRSPGQVLWRLERIRPKPDAIWPTGTPASVVALATAPESLLHAVPDSLQSVGYGDFRMTDFHAGDVTLQLCEGTLQDALHIVPVCRLIMDGPDAEIAALAGDLAEAAPAFVARTTLAEAARNLDGATPALRPLGAPVLPEGLSVGEACAFVCAHLGGVILHYAPLAAAETGTEPVHQMRVAMRRLRSGLSLFRRAVACPELDALQAGLRALGHVLGPARDWDVFATGTCRLVAEAMAEAPEIATLTEAARQRRAECYDRLRAALAGPGFRRLGVTLAVFALARPWQGVAHAPGGARQIQALTLDLRDFAASMLQRRLTRVLTAGERLDDLPEQALHALRLQAKRLRYAAEIFAPLYPRREVARFIRRVSVLQERLGRLNDGAVAAGLMAELDPAIGRGFAGGAVRGFVAARAGDTRADIVGSWRKFRRLDPFWA